MLFTFLIIFFISIVLYNLICSSMKLIEGMENEYKEYSGTDPMILAQQNAGNIEVLRSRVDKLDTVKTDIDGIKQNINSMQVQIDGLVQQNSEMATELAGGSEPTQVSGLEEEQEEEDENNPSTSMEEEI